MRKNDAIDFSIKRKQSWVAVLLIIWKTYVIVFRQALPIIIIAFLGRSDDKQNYIFYGIIVLALISMAYSIISFFRFSFRFDDKELIIEKGIFNIKRTAIDIDRVQNINFEQGILHKIFNVVRLKVDTAGSDKEEFKLDAIDYQVAIGLREQIINTKSIVQSTTDASEVNPEIIPKDETILRLTIQDLLKAGMVENHFKSGGLIFAFLFYIYTNLNDVGVDVEDYTGELSGIIASVYVIIIAVIIIAIISFLISIIRTVIRYYQLRLVRIEGGFNYTSGLFTTKSFSAHDTKVQAITWADNLLKKILKIFDLRFQQAGTIGEEQKQKSIKIPGCTYQHVKQVINYVFPDCKLEEFDYSKLSPLWLKRQLTIRIIFGLFCTTIGYLLNVKMFILGVLLLLVLPLQSILKFRKYKYGFNENYIIIKSGIYGDKNKLIPIYKIQSIEVKTTPYMRRNFLSTLVMHDASGSSTIPYIEDKLANKIGNYILYVSESRANDKWM